MTTEQTVPDGYMRNQVGHPEPLESIQEIDLVRDEFVRGVIVRVKEFSDQLERFKQLLADDIHAFVDLSAEIIRCEGRFRIGPLDTTQNL